MKPTIPSDDTVVRHWPYIPEAEDEDRSGDGPVLFEGIASCAVLRLVDGPNGWRIDAKRKGRWIEFRPPMEARANALVDMIRKLRSETAP